MELPIDKIMDNCKRKQTIKPIIEHCKIKEYDEKIRDKMNSTPVFLRDGRRMRAKKMDPVYYDTVWSQWERFYKDFPYNWRGYVSFERDPSGGNLDSNKELARQQGDIDRIIMIIYKMKRKADDFLRILDDFNMDRPKLEDYIDDFNIEIEVLDGLLWNPFSIYFYLRHDIRNCIMSFWSQRQVELIGPTDTQSIWKLQADEVDDYILFLNINGLREEVKIYVDSPPYIAGMSRLNTRRLYDRWRTEN